MARCALSSVRPAESKQRLLSKIKVAHHRVQIAIQAPTLLTSRRRISRHFPPPWRAEKIHGGYVVRDANDQALAYIYSHKNEADARRFNELTSDEARQLAGVFARLPTLNGGETQVAQRVDLAPRPHAETRRDVPSQSCVRCATPMTLVKIEPDDPVHDHRIFECPTCRHEVRVRVRVVQYR